MQRAEELLFFKGHPFSTAIQRCVSPQKDMGCCQQVSKYFIYITGLFHSKEEYTTAGKRNDLYVINILGFQGKHGHLWPPLWDFSWWELCADQQGDPGGGNYMYFLHIHMWENVDRRWEKKAVISTKCSWNRQNCTAFGVSVSLAQSSENQGIQ